MSSYDIEPYVFYSEERKSSSISLLTTSSYHRDDEREVDIMIEGLTAKHTMDNKGETEFFLGRITIYLFRNGADVHNPNGARWSQCLKSDSVVSTLARF